MRQNSYVFIALGCLSLMLIGFSFRQVLVHGENTILDENGNEVPRLIEIPQTNPTLDEIHDYWGVPYLPLFTDENDNPIEPIEGSFHPGPEEWAPEAPQLTPLPFGDGPALPAPGFDNEGHWHLHDPIEQENLFDGDIYKIALKLKAKCQNLVCDNLGPGAYDALQVRIKELEKEKRDLLRNMSVEGTYTTSSIVYHHCVFDRNDPESETDQSGTWSCEVGYPDPYVTFNTINDGNHDEYWYETTELTTHQIAPDENGNVNLANEVGVIEHLMAVNNDKRNAISVLSDQRDPLYDAVDGLNNNILNLEGLIDILENIEPQTQKERDLIAAQSKILDEARADLANVQVLIEDTGKVMNRLYSDIRDNNKRIEDLNIIINNAVPKNNADKAKIDEINKRINLINFLINSCNLKGAAGVCSNNECPINIGQPA